MNIFSDPKFLDLLEGKDIFRESDEGIRVQIVDPVCPGAII